MHRALVPDIHLDPYAARSKLGRDGLSAATVSAGNRDHGAGPDQRVSHRPSQPTRTARYNNPDIAQVSHRREHK